MNEFHKRANRRMFNSLFTLTLLVAIATTTNAFAQTPDWQSQMVAGRLARDKQDHRKAEEYFTSALKQAENFQPNDERLAHTLTELAYECVANCQYDNARSFYERALAIREKQPGPDDIDLVYTLQSLSWAEISCSNFNKADALYERALAILQGHGKTEETIRCIQNMGVSYLKKDQNKKAEELFGEAIKRQPDYALAYYNRRIAREKIGDELGAREDLESWTKLRHPTTRL